MNDNKEKLVEAEGIIKMRTAHIILAGLRVLRLYTKHKKEKGVEKNARIY